MKLFQATQKNLASLGISPVEAIAKNPFNIKVLAVYFNYGIVTILYSANFDKAQSFEECTEIAFRISVAILVSVQMTVVTLNMKKLFKFIVKCQKVVEKSECYCIKYSSQRFILRHFY